MAAVCFDPPELHYPVWLNCARELLERAECGAVAIRTEAGDWTYARLRATSIGSAAC